MKYSSLKNIFLKEKLIYDFKLIFLDGTEVREKPEKYSDSIEARLRENNILILNKYLSQEEVFNLKNQALKLKKRKKAKWYPYKYLCKDFHHYDTNTKEDDNRRLLEGRKKRPRRFHIFKFLPWNKRNDSFEKSLTDIIKLRNSFYRRRYNSKEFITIPQILNYRPGGDFLGEHSDKYFHKKQGLSSHVEIITLLSNKGSSFKEGGLFIRSSSNKKILVEKYTKKGDLVLYDVKNPHGCAPIDKNASFKDRKNSEGRWMLLVPPYKRSIHIK